MRFCTSGAEDVSTSCNHRVVLELCPAAGDVAAEDEGIHGAADVLGKLESGGGA